MSRAKPAIKTKETKSQILAAVAEATELPKKKVQEVLPVARKVAMQKLVAMKVNKLAAMMENLAATVLLKRKRSS